MADSFNNPRDQGNLEALRAKLEGVVGRLQSYIQTAEAQLAKEATAKEQSASSAQGAARAGSGGRIIEGADATPIRQGTEAVDERIGAEEKLNGLIRERIELEAAAAKAARESVVTGGGGDLLAAASRVQAAEAAAASKGTRGASSDPISAAEKDILAQTGGAANSAAGGVEKLAAAQRTLAGESTVGVATTRSFTDAIEFEARSIAAADDALTRHGALTTEFLSALGRGEVDLRQFGDQMLQTIGKFAGWTGAAALVYGAVTAVTKLKTGAVDAASGVEGLTRFIPNLNQPQAQQDFVNTSESLNVPIKDVSDASQSFARIFKNQADVMTASRVAITATKLDNIALADSYRYLTALTQEYGLSANQLPGLFDQVESAQAKLGARVSELLPALARSAAAVKNAGGDINQLLALEATAIVRTGQTGNTVGTGFSRGASNFYQSAASQQLLQQKGITTTNFTQALIQAIAQESKPGVSGTERLDVSKAFFGPLRGGILAGLFRANDTTQKALAETSPSASQGQAATELAKVNAQADQRLKQLGNDLEALGASLASSGLLTDIGLLVAGLNSFLQATTGLLNTFDRLPPAVKEGTGVIAGLVGSLLLLRRFNVIGSVGAFRSGESAYLGTTVTGLQNDQRSLGRSFTAAGSEAAYAKQAQQAALAAGDADAAAAAEAAYRDAIKQQVAIAGRRASIEAEIAGLQEQQTFIANAKRSELVAERDRIAGLGPLGGGAAAGGASIGATEKEATAATQATIAMDAQTAATERLALAAGLAAEAEVAEGVATVGLVASLGAGLAAVGSFIFGLGGLAVAAGAYGVYRAVDEGRAREDAGITGLANSGIPDYALRAAQKKDSGKKKPGVVELLAALNQQYDNATTPHGLADTIGTAYTHGLGDLLGGGAGAFERGDATKNAIDQARVGAHDQLNAQLGTENVGLRDASGIENGLKADLPGLHTVGEKVTAIKEALKKLSEDKALETTNPGVYEAAKTSLENQLTAVSTTSKSLGELIRTMNAKELTGFLGTSQLSFDIQGPSSSTGFKQAAAAAARIAELIGTPGNDVKTLVTDYKKAQEQITQNANASLQSALALAGSDVGAQASARGSYLSELHQPITATQSELTSLSKAGKLSHTEATALRELLDQQLLDYKVAKEEMAKAQEQAAVALSDAQSGLTQSSTQDPVQKAQDAYQQAGRDLQILAQSGINDPVQKLQLLQKQKDALSQVVDAQLTQYSNAQKLSEAQSDIGATDQAKLETAVSFAQQAVDHIRGLGSSVSPDKLNTALINLAQAQGAVVDYVRQQARDLIDAETALASARDTNDPVKQARDALAGAQRLLAFDQSHGATQAALVKDQADVTQRRADLQNQIIATRLRNIEFQASVEYSAQGIDPQTEISRLQQLLTLTRKGTADYQQIAAKIYELTQGQSGALNLNTGSLQLPTTYDVKAAILGGRAATKRRTAAGLLADVKTNVNLSVIVNRDADMKKFSDALEKALGTSVNGLAQAAGLV